MGMETERWRGARVPEGVQPKIAAVALILYERDGEPWLLFTRRTDRVGDHKGQICFPGGSQDPTDASLVDTALREVQEEVGIEQSALRVVASLEPVYTVATRYLITPFVAYAPRPPEPRPQAGEVAEVFDAPVSALLDPTIQRVERWDNYGVPRNVYFFQYGDHNIWGATARMLKQFLDTCYTPEWWQAVRRGEVEYRPPRDTPPTPV